jgi:hypothetical protein
MDDRALRALLAGIIDYAGLFPPAELELEPALRNYAEYRRGGQTWMLGRFICPMSRLRDLVPLARELFEPAEPLALSVILPPAPSGAALVVEAPALAMKLASHLEVLGGLATIEALELKLPPDLAQATEAPPSANALDGLAASFDAVGLRPALFVERALSGRFRAPLEALVEALRAFNLSGHSRGFPSWGLKIRCGGVTPEAFPLTEAIAVAVTACRDRGVPFKATAGLHHPLPRFDERLGARTQGFLNLFGGAALAGALGLSEAQVGEIMNDDEPASFDFEGDGLAWRGQAASSDEIARERHDLATTFGSCSFDEPIADLKELGLLPGPT